MLIRCQLEVKRWINCCHKAGTLDEPLRPVEIFCRTGMSDASASLRADYVPLGASAIEVNFGK